MIVLIIILSIILLLLLCLLLPVKLHLTYEQDIRLTAKLLFLKLWQYPKPQRVKISDYKYKKYRKKLEKARQKKKDKKTPVKRTAPKKRRKRSLITKLKLVSYLVSRIYKAFLRGLKIKVKTIDIRVASEDSAKTAMLYPAVYGALDTLLINIADITNLTDADAEHIKIYCDFLETEPKCEIKLVFSIKMISLLDIGFKLAYNYLKRKRNIT